MNYTQNPDDQDEPIPVAVAVRVKRITEQHQKSVILSPKQSEITLAGGSVGPEKFRFDHILNENVSQEETFSRVLSPFLPLIYDGFDLYVITYGGTGTGKSYTLFGPDLGPLGTEDDAGILPRFAHHIFANFNAAEMAVKVSSFDVTSDDISDLLSTATTGQRRKSLIGNRDVQIEPATEHECSSAEEVIQCYESSVAVNRLKSGFQNSVISHHFFKVILEQRIDNIGKKSTVTFVDLAPSDTVLVQGSLGMHSSQSHNHVNMGLLSLRNVVRGLGDPRNVSQSDAIYQHSLLIRLLKNAFAGKALTLLFTCISPKIEDAEETLETLNFAKSANNIRNFPVPNVSQIGSEFSDEEEEIRYINRCSAQNQQKLLPDLLHPNFMHQFLVQQQMLQHYLMMQQAQEQPQQKPQQPQSPFIPISSPASTLDLKSPLNVQMYLNENTTAMQLQHQQPPPLLQHQQQKQVPTQPQPRTQESVENEVGGGGYEKPQPRERKSSLAAVQKTLDSILEESEHDSSTKRSTLESENESDYSEEQDSKPDYESEVESEEESEGDENFDSEEEIVSDLEELLDSEDILRTFQMDTDEFIKKEQESILNEFIQNNSDLSTLTQNLERLHSDIANLDALIKAKDKILEEATRSSIELNQAKETLERKLSELKQDSSSIRKQLSSAKRKLDLASTNRRSNSTQKFKVQDLKAKLNECRKNTGRIETLIKTISHDQRPERAALTPSYEDLVTEKQRMEEMLSQEMKRMEMARKHDQLKIEQLHEQLTRLSVTQDEEIVEEAEVNGDDHRSRIERLRREKEKFGTEKSLLEHLREKSRRTLGPTHSERKCDLCKELQAQGLELTKEHERRIIEIDAIHDTFDALIDHLNAQMTGHAFVQPTVSDTEEQEKLMSYLAQMTGDEAKYLLSYQIHRNIDMRVEGKDNVRMMTDLDLDNDQLRKNLQKQFKARKVLENENDLKYREEERRMYKKLNAMTKELDRTLAEKKELEARCDKYKRFYLYCSSNHKPDHDHHHHRSETPKSSRNDHKEDKRVKHKENKKLKIKPSKTFNAIDSIED